MIRNLLVICVGNICRSPMAEFLFRRDLDGVTVTSAGLDALAGHVADPHAVTVCATHGLPLDTHRARQVNAALVSAADLVLTMEAAHKYELVRRYPFASGKVFRLGEFDGFDVPDPYRQPIAQFNDAFDLIERGAESWTSRIKALA